MTTRTRSHNVRVSRRGTGYAAEAPRFYLWDEDAGELLRTAAAFSDACAAPHSGTTRATLRLIEVARDPASRR